MKSNRLELENYLKELYEKGIELCEKNGCISYIAPKGEMTKVDIEKIKENKGQILVILEDDKKSKLENYYKPFELTDVQSAYLLGRENIYKYGNVACHIYMEIVYPKLDTIKAEQVWNKLIERHDMLRGIFTDDKKQKILEKTNYYNIKYNDLSNSSLEEKTKTLNIIRKDLGNQKFDTNKWPLFDIQISKLENFSILHLSMDFLVADWSSIILLISEFEMLYENINSDLPIVNFSFNEYVKSEKSKKNGEKYIRDKEYWHNRIKDFPSAPKLPLSMDQNENEVVFERHSLHIDKGNWESIKKFAKQYRLTPSAIVLTCYALTIGKWSESKRFSLNLTVLNRPQEYEDINKVVGDFTSISLLEIDINEKLKFVDYARKVQKQLMEDMEHGSYSGIEVIRELARERGYEESLMPIVFTSAIGLYKQNNISPIKGKFSDFGISQTPQVFIDCQVMDNENGLDLNWDIRKGIIKEQIIDDMFGTLKETLNCLSEDNNLWNSDELVIIPKYQSEIIKKVNDTGYTIEPKLLYEDIYEMAKKYPDKTAVIDGQNKITYKQLIDKALKISEKLIAEGVEEGDKIAVLMPKSLDQVTAVLGILFSGCCYVPLDIEMPEDRIKKIMAKANGKYVLINNSINQNFNNSINIHNIYYDYISEFKPSKISPKNIAYIIFTSGSTGEPKGVEISHEASWNTISAINNLFNVNYKDSILGVSRLCFDLSVYDIFGILSVGGTLIYPLNDRLIDPSHWCQLIYKYNVTLWNSVPALMEMLLSSIENLEYKKISKLRLSLLSGDWIPMNLPNKIKKYCEDVKVVSLGGATEASIWSIYHVIDEVSEEYASIPYGMPLYNQEFTILDNKFEICPMWVKGDIYIKGKGLSKGYIDDPINNKKSYFKDPIDGNLMYKTGDKGFYHPDGNIEFLGREDSQVKIRGYRIELKEIEKVLESFDSVDTATVVVNRDSDNKDIVAAIKMKEKEESEDKTQNILNLSNINPINSKYDVNMIDRSHIYDAFKLLDNVVENAMLSTLEQLGFFDLSINSYESFLKEGSIKQNYIWIIKRWITKLEQLNLIVNNYMGNYSISENHNIHDIENDLKLVNEKFSNIPGTTKLINYVISSIRNLSNVLIGKVDPINILYPQNDIEYVRKFYKENLIFDYLNNCIVEIVSKIDKSNSKNPLRILEVGAGTGATTDKILEDFKDREIEYYFSDNTNYFLTEAKKRYKNNNNVHFIKYDIDEDYRKQGINSNSFDIVIAVGVLENAKRINETINRLVEIIKPEGWLVFIDPVKDLSWILVSQIFMMTEPEDLIREKEAYLSEESWTKIISQHTSSDIVILPNDDKLRAFGVSLFASKIKENKIYVNKELILEEVKEKLPNYMVPNHIEIIDEMPLTSNGKIDIKTIEKYSKVKVIEEVIDIVEKSEIDYVDKYLIEVWQESLGISNINKNEDLYNYGADSLIIAQAVSKICKRVEEWTKIDNISFEIMLRTVLNQPNIKSLSDFIKAHKLDNKSSSYDDNKYVKKFNISDYIEFNLIKEDNNSDLLRVFFHSGMGCINEYRFLEDSMKKTLKGNIATFSIKDVEIYRKIPKRDYVKQLSDIYAKIILENKKDNIQLIGHSFGGMLAFEVASRLLESGVNIYDLALLDSYPITIDIQDDLVMEAMFQLAINTNLNDFGVSGFNFDEVAYLISYISERGNVINEEILFNDYNDKKIKETQNKLKKMASIDKELRFKSYTNQTIGEIENGMIQEMFYEFTYSSKALEYEPQVYAGDIKYFRSVSSYESLRSYENKGVELLKDLCIGDFKDILIQGDHFSIVQDKNKFENILKLL
ncbi:non-ribosomal peptide synthetase [Clostridium botulinum]|uniref:non-ribosomal peptide synthetase n=1 Tax=Clostridium botulinum TaxID=1491 RepID=UPI000774507E|nr:non-ribosomal peptide synthetase [Clostridium botulinum]